MSRDGSPVDLTKVQSLLSIVCLIITLPDHGNCVVNLYSTSGYISSLNYPNRYPNNYENTWVIIVPPSYSVTLTFPNFELEGSGRNCIYDYVEVRQYNPWGTSLTGKLCGTAGLSQTVTSLTSLWIIFKTDYAGQYSGFRAQYTQSVVCYVGTLCTFSYETKCCTYGCCEYDCCTTSNIRYVTLSMDKNTSDTKSDNKSTTTLLAWLIPVIVISIFIGLVIVFACVQFFGESSKCSCNVSMNIRDCCNYNTCSCCQS